MEVNTIRDAFDRVVKKQKLSTSNSQDVIDQVGSEIEQTLRHVQSDHDSSVSSDKKSIFTELADKLGVIGSHNKLDGSQKELNINLSKYQKVLEKSLNSDISKAQRDLAFDSHIVNQIIISHFYREGLFEIADSLINEAGEPEVISLRLQFVEMHQILEAIKSKNLKPALRWVSANSERLHESGSNLELKLHRMQFVEILKNGTQKEALNYARTYLAPFASLHMKEIQKLMGCLLWAGKLERSPYTDLMTPTPWEKLSEELTRQFCSMLGQSYQSPLSVAIAAGVEGLPTLLKLASVMALKKHEWQAMKHLPVPVELSKEFHFHSIFVCPVSRDQASDENPPMLLPCGHVLCKQSIHKLSKSSTRAFKCPYCPLDASVSQCRQLYF